MLVLLPPLCWSILVWGIWWDDLQHVVAQVGKAATR